MIRKDKEEIWNWYKILEDWKTSGLRPKDYCDKSGLKYEKFCNMRYRIEYKRERDPELYKKLLSLGRMYLISELKPVEFGKRYEINTQLLSEVVTHIHYLDIIDEIKSKKENNSMMFVQVPTMNLPMPTPQEPKQEVLKKQNEVELVISSGVKVVVAPEVGADKLIRIIELMKDL